MATGPPSATPVTSPVPLTVARAALLVAHVTVRPVSTVPLASFVVAVSCTVCPTGTVAVAGATATEATDTGPAADGAVASFPEQAEKTVGARRSGSNHRRDHLTRGSKLIDPPPRPQPSVLALNRTGALVAQACSLTRKSALVELTAPV